MDELGGLRLSVVVPMFNEEETLAVFFATIVPILEELTLRFEIVCINDGSSDQTLSILSSFRSKDERIKIIDLSRNFGKEHALSAGLDHATGEAVIPLDAGLQDPPELIPEMVKKWREGYDVVLAVREDRDSDSLLKRITANGFYKVFGFVSDTDMPANVGDYRLMDRCVVDALKQLPERNRFMKGLFAWLGFRQARVYFRRPSRSAGTSKWNSWKLWNFALDGIFSFSIAPLRIWTYLGLLLSVVAVIYLLYIVSDAIFVGNPVAGYPSLIAVILFFNGVIMIGMGIQGE